MNAPPFPTNPNVGEFYQNWVWNGVRWVSTPAAGVRVVIQTFTESGPYMPSPGLVTAVVECIGGGGGGGGALGNASEALAGGGGGSGGYSRIALAASLVAGGVQVTIGAGGAGAPGTAVTASPGTATTFGALCVANGGGGAGATGSGGGGQGGQGGAVGTGEMAFSGVSGVSGMSFLTTPSVVNFVHAGTGGAIFGGNMPGLDLNATATPPYLNGQNAVPNTGAGGTGGSQFGSTTTTNGGNGASGFCIVTEFCWSDTAPDGVNPTMNVNARVAIARDKPGWRPHGGEPFEDGGEFDD